MRVAWRIQRSIVIDSPPQLVLPPIDSSASRDCIVRPMRSLSHLVSESQHILGRILVVALLCSYALPLRPVPQAQTLNYAQVIKLRINMTCGVCLRPAIPLQSACSLTLCCLAFTTSRLSNLVPER